MERKRLRSWKDDAFEQAIQIYRTSFPFHEQRQDESQRKILSHEDYHFELLYEADVLVGLICFWQWGSMIYVEHFCMAPEHRGKGLGSQALQMLKETGKTVILEIDPPVDEISIRRKGFYERCGFVKNPYAHVHPPYHDGYQGHELVVMSSPVALEQPQYDAFARYLAQTVMSQ